MNASELWDRHVSLPLESFDLHPITLSNIESLVLDYFPKDYTDMEKQMALSANKGTIIKYILSHLDDLNDKEFVEYNKELLYNAIEGILGSPVSYYGDFVRVFDNIEVYLLKEDVIIPKLKKVKSN